MEAPITFSALEWSVAKVRNAIERHDSREEDQKGKGQALLEHAIEDLDNSVEQWRDAAAHAKGE